ncbi:MAG: hypothetical protein K8F52_04865 [Candidatus Scalindua rubra]|uniref:Uncharacterized protein n=1 Tax=Candidatus Scalindua brodae TaxID=237368 RepID=A0A0B0EHP4_9BACT|nr:MAG: hypothetical protein SCABRO_01678 [Candidatus Scalindua brodae]MBZ0107978.1 hypothetical protein [Candidatus Scalindua rubra]
MLRCSNTLAELTIVLQLIFLYIAEMVHKDNIKHVARTMAMLINADNNLKVQEIPFDTVRFHCQQAVEKGSIPILLYIKEVDSLRLIHPTSHHTFAYL